MKVGVKSSERNGAALRCRKGINDFSHDDVVVDVLSTRKLLSISSILLESRIVVAMTVWASLFAWRRRGLFVIKEG